MYPTGASAGRVPAERRIGVIRRIRGAGKSLTKAFFAEAIARDPRRALRPARRLAPGARQLGQARLGAAADQVTVWGATGFHIPLRLPTSPVGAREGREDIGRDKKLDKDSGQKLLLSLTALKI